ncbi:Putative integral membrane protein [Campylobacter insulaenigrae]|uniref:hypothetical protein n=1 Tax=Campylobacter insulaenigrae TaxID=260714 RepID=UPI000F6B4C39|nr:hypothetical protein [Campylobacter insulaenigrae]MCR6591194.1 hypothetical protein [Campylobacter insulaenigrae]MCR6592672.1 hypothetical protein [Campylobacter insulaenigrae]VEJ53048.1 Putative integral membrane protein [Campylobacter insulaenigrae]
MEKQTKEQAIEEISTKLKITKDKILYVEYSNLFQINDCKISIVSEIFQKYNLFFYNCDIPNLVLDFFVKSVEFNLCNFENGLIIRDNFGGTISIRNNIFSEHFNILWTKNKISKIDIRKNIFKNVMICENQILNFNFEENSIQSISVSKNLFNKEACFNNNRFDDECIFFSNSFENLSFYGSNFEKSFIFFQNTIKGNLNAVNTNLNFTFDELQEKIKQEYEDFNQNKKEQNKKPLYKFANDFRDSFRTFKGALIKENNPLEASNFHKYELYCKEIELRENWNKRGKKAQNMFEVQRNTWIFRDFIDSLLLGFYRKLCEHHTDFLRVFNNLILLIALYALFVYFGGCEIKQNSSSILYAYLLENISSFLIDFKEYILNLSFTKEHYNFISVSFAVLCLICLMIAVYFILKDIKKDWRIIKNFIDCKNTIINIIKLFIYLFALLCALIVLNIFIPPKLQINNPDILWNIGVFFSFIILYLWIVYLNSLFLRYLLIVFSYIITIIAIGINIAILNPFIGKLISDKIEFKDPSFAYATFAYAILMFLVLFSLQKTARKNSIIPT